MIGKLIKWTTSEFSYTGVCIKADKRIAIVTDVGTMEFPATDGKIEVLGDAPAAQAAKVKAEPIKTVKKPAGAGTKLEQAIAVYTRMKGSSRKEIIEAIVSEVGMTPAGASTYYAQAKKVTG